MKIVVIGLGEFGQAAALALARSGVEVVAIDRNMTLVTKMKDVVSLAVCLDATQEGALESNGIADADVLVAAMGHEFEAEVLTVVHAKRLGIPRVVARAMTPNHARVLSAVGADEVLDPEEETARRLAQRLLIPDIQAYFELAEGFSIVEVAAPPGTVGKTLEQLELRRRFRTNLVAIKHRIEGEPGREPTIRFDPIPLPGTVIQATDVLALVGSDLDIANLMSELSG